MEPGELPPSDHNRIGHDLVTKQRLGRERLNQAAFAAFSTVPGTMQWLHKYSPDGLTAHR